MRPVQSSTTIEEIEGVSDFIQKLDKITLPNQLVSALEDPLLRIYLILRNDDLPNHRIDDWLSLFFDAQVQIEQSREKPSKTLVEILGKSLSYAHHAKVLPTPVQTFLGIFLENWNGKHHLDLILGLLAYLNMNSYQELQGSILQKLELALLDDSVESGAALLKYYTSLTKQWTAILLSLPDPHPQNLAGVNSSLALLTDRASLLSLSLLVTYTPTQTTISTILNYHETLAFAISHAVTQPSIRILTPFSEIVYLLIFHNPTLATLSRLCSILAIYKRTFEAAMSKGSAGAIHEYPRDYVNHFNGFLMDICNLLWRSRAFNTSDTNALGCLISPAMWPSLHTYLDALMPPHVLATTFSLSHNISLSALSTSSFRSLEDRAVAEGNLLRTRHAGPVTQKSLEALAIDGGIRFGWADYRLEVLNWLGDRGVGGVGELMFCTMKHLMGMKPAGVR
ncbi:hypothetical protein MMC13_001441 [Lambiella insularis]|nr:hypothetical protein [Lambiella insularis]